MAFYYIIPAHHGKYRWAVVGRQGRVLSRWETYRQALAELKRLQEET